MTVTPQEALEIQRQERHRVRCEDDFGGFEAIKTVAGVDVSSEDGTLYAAVVVLSYPQLEILTVTNASGPSPFPYIPGLLSFREIPILLEAWEKLTLRPDLILVDGQGIAHPRRFGIGAHLGVTLDVPTIGCAKRRLVGRHEEPGPHKGDWSPLVDKGETIGAVLRTKDHVSPMFISCGHRVSLPSAIQLVLSCTTRYRLPEPTRQAHLASNVFRKSLKEAK